jgi:hypothetical protein
MEIDSYKINGVELKDAKSVDGKIHIGGIEELQEEINKLNQLTDDTLEYIELSRAIREKHRFMGFPTEIIIDGEIQ